MNKDQSKEADSASKYQMKLFVSGNDRNSREARQSIERLCNSRLQGLADLEIIDVLKDYKAALLHNVLVAPTLIINPSKQPDIKEQPLTIVGSLRDISKVLKALGISDTEEVL